VTHLRPGAFDEEYVACMKSDEEYVACMKSKGYEVTR